MPDQKFPIPTVEKTFGVEQPKVEPLPAFVEPVYVPPAPIEQKYVPRSTATATVKIHHPAGGFCLIDSDSFNPHEHTLWVEPATDKA